MATPRTTVAPYQETELVIINSSPIKAWACPNPRVIKRKENHYMCPRSPISPFGGKVAPLSGSSSARLKSDYVKINGKIFLSSRDTSGDNFFMNCYLVSELQVKPLEYAKVNDRNANQSLPIGMCF